MPKRRLLLYTFISLNLFLVLICFYILYNRYTATDEIRHMLPFTFVLIQLPFQFRNIFRVACSGDYEFKTKELRGKNSTMRFITLVLILIFMVIFVFFEINTFLNRPESLPTIYLYMLPLWLIMMPNKPYTGLYKKGFFYNGVFHKWYDFKSFHISENTLYIIESYDSEYVPSDIYIMHIDSEDSSLIPSFLKGKGVTLLSKDEAKTILLQGKIN